jgi:hypothetical protein
MAFPKVSRCGWRRYHALKLSILQPPWFAIDNRYAEVERYRDSACSQAEPAEPGNEGETLPNPFCEPRVSVKLGIVVSNLVTPRGVADNGKGPISVFVPWA